MMTREPKKDTPVMSRRTALAGAAAGAITPAEAFGALPHPFDRWVAEAYVLMDLGWSLPEEPEGPRQRIFRRVDRLERLIVRTPSLDEPAIRAKFGYLRWIMKNNGDDDDLVAMDHVGEFIRQHCSGPWDLYTPR